MVEAAPSVLIATWPFGTFATDGAQVALQAGGSVLDAVESGIKEVERRNCDGTVGIGGRPNAAGYTQVDACIMRGDDHQAGSVAGVEGIIHPVSAARLVMEKSKHAMLVGEGARWFALEHGLESIDVSALPEAKAAWVNRPAGELPGTSGHDTIALLAIDRERRLAGASSSSGAANKLPGRVGDSPIIGSGLYVDKSVGACAATGQGENIMRHILSYSVVGFMEAGKSPQEACEAAIHKAARKEGTYRLDMCLIAVGVDGKVGAASSNDTFPYVACCGDGPSELRTAPPLAPVEAEAPLTDTPYSVTHCT